MDAQVDLCLHCLPIQLVPLFLDELKKLVRLQVDHKFTISIRNRIYQFPVTFTDQVCMSLCNTAEDTK